MPKTSVMRNAKPWQMKRETWQAGWSLASADVYLPMH